MQLDYAKVEQFGILYCEFQRLGKGDKFATEAELEAIKSDIFAWLDLWWHPLLASLGVDPSCYRHYQLDVDHFSKTVTVTNTRPQFYVW